MVLIDRMLQVISDAQMMGEPLREYRLHPDDFRALRAQCEPHLRFEAAPGSADQFAGVLIVEDETAERLPSAACSHTLSR